MRGLPKHLPFGVPVKYEVTVNDGYDHDNLYLIRLNFIKVTSAGQFKYAPQFHLFTTNELIDATVRYYHDMDKVIDSEFKFMPGYAYPMIYENKNGISTTRFYCRFKGDQVLGLGKGFYSGLFTTREINRSKKRVMMYVTWRPIRIIFQLEKVVKRWFTRIMKNTVKNLP